MKNKAAFTAPFLLCVVFVLLCLSGAMVDAVQSVSANSYISVSIIQIFVLLLPVAFYCGIRRLSFFASVRIRPVRWRDIPFLLLCACVFLFGAATLKFLGFSLFGAAAAHTAPLIAELPLGTSNAPLVFLCFILIPALLEELLFRGLIFSEYRFYGPFGAILVSAAMFAMGHFSFENFVFYLFCGIVFGVMTQVSGSIVPAMVLHVLYNLIDVYYESTFFDYVAKTGSSAVLFYFFCGLFLLFFVLTLGNLEHTYARRARSVREGAKRALEEEASRQKAQKNEPESAAKGEKLREIVFNPGVVVLVILFLIRATGIL